MAHWVGIVKQPERIVVTGSSKEGTIQEISRALMKQGIVSPIRIREIVQQLQQLRERVAIAYGENPDDEIAKVFPCNCGSIIRHHSVKDSDNNA